MPRICCMCSKFRPVFVTIRKDGMNFHFCSIACETMHPHWTEQLEREREEEFGEIKINGARSIC